MQRNTDDTILFTELINVIAFCPIHRHHLRARSTQFIVQPCEIEKTKIGYYNYSLNCNWLFSRLSLEKWKRTIVFILFSSLYWVDCVLCWLSVRTMVPINRGVHCNSRSHYRPLFQHLRDIIANSQWRGVSFPELFSSVSTILTEWQTIQNWMNNNKN